MTEGRCFEARAAACYLPSTHTISIESGGTLRSLLHELAHALITGDAVMADCYADWTNVVPHCAHGALFRCAADALYVRYADLQPAGVCGDPPDLGDWTHRNGETVNGKYDEWRATEADDGLLALRCEGGRLTLYAWGRTANFGYGFGRGGTGVVRYRFKGQSDPTQFVVREGDDAGWVEDFGDLWVMSRTDASRFLADMAADTSGLLYLHLIEIDEGIDHVEAAMELRTTGYRAHIQPHVEACTSSQESAEQVPNWPFRDHKSPGQRLAARAKSALLSSLLGQPHRSPYEGWNSLSTQS